MDIKDFGEKIGGARKDMYSRTNMDLLNDNEAKLVTRDKIWKKPNIIKETENGTDRLLLYWKEQVRKSLPTKPAKSYKHDDAEICRAYIRAVNQVKDFCESCQEIDQYGLATIAGKYFEKAGYYIHPINIEGESLNSAKMWNLATIPVDKLRRNMTKEEFGMTEQEKLTARLERDLFIAEYLGEFSRKDVPTPSYQNICYMITEEREENCKQLHIKSNCVNGTFYLYKKRCKYFDSEWKKNTFMVISYSLSDRIVAFGFETKEEAEKIRKDLIAVGASVDTGTKKTGKEGKKAFPIQLSHVKQEGGYRTTRNITGNDYLESFRFRGGEFGNWMNENDRQTSLNMGYTAFMNLADVLGISDGDVSLGGQLAIAFGARGRSAARAHYEPARNVINLTKMSGAGATAHEWGHSLDAFLAEKFGKGGSLYSEARGIKGKCPEMDDILESMSYVMAEETIDKQTDLDKYVKRAVDVMTGYMSRYHRYDKEKETEVRELVKTYIPEKVEDVEKLVEKFSAYRKQTIGHILPKSERESLEIQLGIIASVKEDIIKNGRNKVVKRRVDTEYKKGSKYFDSNYKKNGGYWESSCEMFARAFDCYIEDKLKGKGISDTYLSGFASCYVMKDEKTGQLMRAYPYGEERKLLNEKFDKLFEKLREDGTFLKKTKSLDKITRIPDIKNWEQISIFDLGLA